MVILLLQPFRTVFLVSYGQGQLLSVSVEKLLETSLDLHFETLGGLLACGERWDVIFMLKQIILA